MSQGERCIGGGLTGPDTLVGTVWNWLTHGSARDVEAVWEVLRGLWGASSGGVGNKPLVCNNLRREMAVRQGFEPWEEVNAPSTV